MNATETASPITHGAYVVISGNTFRWSKELREAGLRFDRGAKVWAGTINSPDREIYGPGVPDTARPWMTPPMIKTGRTEISHLVRDLRKAIEARELFVGPTVKAVTGRESWQSADGHLNYDF